MMLKRRSSRGFTLIEIIIVIVLVGVMMGGMSTMFMSNIGKSHYPFLRQRALAVAVAFMDEILYKRWNENSPIGGGCVQTASSCVGGPAVVVLLGNDAETRSQYDDVDDFNGINNQSPPQDSSGNNMPGYNGFSVTVTVSQPAGPWQGVPAADVRVINVSVTSSSNETISLTAYRINI